LGYWILVIGYSLELGIWLLEFNTARQTKEHFFQKPKVLQKPKALMTVRGIYG